MFPTPTTPSTQTAEPGQSTAERPTRSEAGRAASGMPRKTIALGAVGSALLAVGAVGAAGVLVHDPLLAGSPFSWVRYGHGRDLATAVVYAGFFMVVWAWVRLGRGVLAGLVSSRGVLAASAAWIAPLLIAPPLFTRDAYSYLAQGALAAEGIDPYGFGPEIMPGPITDNVHYFWQDTPAPYGPLFILLAKGIYLVTGNGLITGVVAMRLVLLPGLVLVCWALPGLVRHLGGRLPVALWLLVASPMTVVHLVGGPHNDLLMIGLLAAGVLLVLERRHVSGIVLITLAMAVKATAVVALPFVVWIWAARLSGSQRARFGKALAASLAVFLPVFTAVTLVAGVTLGWIPALQAPSAIVNWLSIPTGVGEAIHGLVSVVIDLDKMPFITVTRGIGLVLLVVIAVRQWWRARAGGPDAVRRTAIVLFAVAILSPAILPWYLTWALVLAAGLPWRRPALVAMVGADVWLVLVAYPSGESGLYDWLYVLGAAAVSVLAAVSLVRPDPLRLSSRGPAATLGEPEQAKTLRTPSPERGA
jgi:alpha-1,6-mannosyltransferase